MIVKKQIRGSARKRKGGKSVAPYVCFRPFNKQLFLNCEVRDAILPHSYIAVEILENLDFVLRPTDDESEYRVSIAAGVTTISGNQFADHYKAGVHIPAEIRNDGTILCRAKLGGAT